jgi:hypothetical protein
MELTGKLNRINQLDDEIQKLKGTLHLLELEKNSEVRQLQKLCDHKYDVYRYWDGHKTTLQYKCNVCRHETTKKPDKYYNIYDS